MNLKELNKILGPGLLYAAAAVGVSHLVQSTKAGANYGFILIWAIVICHIIKYPFFKIAPLYTHATGKTLLEGYKNIGKWAIPLFMIMTLLTMFIIQAAVTIVTAGISLNILGLDLPATYISCILLVITGLILQTDKYHWLDKIVKVIIVILTITTFISVIMAMLNSAPKAAGESLTQFNLGDPVHLGFLIALIGWMPAPMDVPIWHSLWTKAKHDADGERANHKEANLDFSIGYFGTAVLAIGFLALGALIMYGSGETFSPKGAVFASQLIGLYTKTLGNWSYPIIALASFTTMFSTTLTCLDAFPRILTEATKIQKDTSVRSYTVYRIWLLITILGSCILLLNFAENMGVLVKLATTVSFTIAPIYAYLNYRVINAKDTPEQLKYHGKLKYFPLISLIIMAAFSIYYLFTLI